MNNEGVRKVADKGIEKNGFKRQQQLQRTLLRKPSFAYRKSIKMPLLLFRVFINRGDKNMLVKMLNVYMVCSNEPNGLVSLDIYGMPKKVDMAIQLVLRFIHYEETTSVGYNVSREKYEALYHSNPNVFKEIGTKNGVLLAVVNSTTNPRHQMDITITGRRMQIDNATKALAELFFPKFTCAICFAEFLIEAGMVTCDKQLHSICVECFQTYSHTSITGQVAYGGIGLRCVDMQCDSAILLSSFGFYVLEADYKPLVRRLQLQCIIDADMNDLVKCSQCDFKLSVDPTLAYFKCICGRFQCRTCARPYNQKHKGKTCAQMNEDEAKENSATKM
uniref:RING-type domain-containing protein n=1 Tax=Panagrolaimus davidi TaxID=227884 RepID=A0A914PF58_9BILA